MFRGAFRGCSGVCSGFAFRGGVGVCEGLFWGGVFGVVFADVPRTCHSTARPSRAFAHTPVTVTPKAAVDAEQLKSAVKEAISKAGFQVE